MSAWQIYWITRLDAFRAIEIVGLAAGILAVMLPLPVLIEPSIDQRVYRIARKSFMCGIAALFLSLCGMVFVPTMKEAAAIAVLPRIANSETVAEIGAEAKALAVEWLKDLRRKGEEQ